MVLLVTMPTHLIQLKLVLKIFQNQCNSTLSTTTVKKVIYIYFSNLIFIIILIVRSLSFDVHGKGATVVTENSGKKLDTSFNECGIVGHRRVKSKIPKLNLEVLPNYHGKSNKSINN